MEIGRRTLLVSGSLGLLAALVAVGQLGAGPVAKAAVGVLKGPGGPPDPGPGG